MIPFQSVNSREGRRRFTRNLLLGISALLSLATAVGALVVYLLLRQP